MRLFPKLFRFNPVCIWVDTRSYDALIQVYSG
jgi:hypothetical protein